MRSTDAALRPPAFPREGDEVSLPGDRWLVTPAGTGASAGGERGEALSCVGWVGSTAAWKSLRERGEKSRLPRPCRSTTRPVVSRTDEGHSQSEEGSQAFAGRRLDGVALEASTRSR